jgi:hypothetical protein
MDRYTKIVLTLIAFALWANLFVSLSPPGGLVRDARAQGITRAVIVGVDMAALPVAIAPGQAAPVYLTPGPNPTNPALVSVNLAQIGSRSFQQGVALPVDIEGIAGAAVKSSPGLPVAVAQPVSVTAKDPLPIAARDPLPVMARDPLAVASKVPLQVIVTKLPVSAAQVPNSQSTSGYSNSSVPPPPGAPGS